MRAAPDIQSNIPNYNATAADLLTMPTNLVVAEHFEHALKERGFSQIRERVFAAAEVDATSRPLALEWMD